MSSRAKSRNLHLARTHPSLWNQATLGCAVISSFTEALDDAANRIAVGLGAEIADSYAEILD